MICRYKRIPMASGITGKKPTRLTINDEDIPLDS